MGTTHATPILLPATINHIVLDITPSNMERSLTEEFGTALPPLNNWDALDQEDEDSIEEPPEGVLYPFLWELSNIK